MPFKKFRRRVKPPIPPSVELEQLPLVFNRQAPGEGGRFGPYEQRLPNQEELYPSKTEPRTFSVHKNLKTGDRVYDTYLDLHPSREQSLSGLKAEPSNRPYVYDLGAKPYPRAVLNTDTMGLKDLGVFKHTNPYKEKPLDMSRTRGLLKELRHKFPDIRELKVNMADFNKESEAENRDRERWKRLQTPEERDNYQFLRSDSAPITSRTIKLRRK